MNNPLMNSPNLPARYESAPAIPYSDLERMGERIAKSGLFGIRTADQAIALMLIAQAEGRHPAAAARDYHVIQGSASLRAETMLARFQNAGGRVKWTSYTDDKVSAVFSMGEDSLEVDWTTERAKTADLLGKDNWKHYKRAMLRSRVISEAIRTLYPQVLSGMYTPEEIQDGAAPVRELRDVTSTTRLPAADLDAFAGDQGQPVVDPDVGASGMQGAPTAPSGTRLDPEPPPSPSSGAAGNPGGATPYRIPVGHKDGVTDWPGWCSQINAAYLAAADEPTLQAIREQNLPALKTIAGGGKGGKAAADKLQATFTSCQVEMWRRAAEDGRVT